MGTHPIFESDFDCLTVVDFGEMGDEDGALRLVVLGHAGVGKSSLCLRFTQNEFPDDHMTTLITDTYEKWHTFSTGKKKNKTRRKLIITDTAGQEEMESLLDTHIKDKDAVILVLSVIDRESFNRASRTYKTTVDYFKNSIYNGNNKPTTDLPMPVAVVLNKIDLRDDKPQSIQIERDEIIDKFNLQKSQVIETSALKSINVEKAFETAICLIPGMISKSKGDKGCPIS